MECFQQNYESLERLPLISEPEMSLLFGPEVVSALAELENYNRQEQLCPICRGGCCRLVSCEFYIPELACCPVQEFRPLLCRMHFCYRFARVYPRLVKEIGDIYLESLIAAEKAGCKNIYLFDCPPLKKAAPGLVGYIVSELKKYRQGSAGKEEILEAIETILAGYRPG
ncbi:MAG: hypothetical protein JXA46_03255 [Dehalococcoidales bacterium]|nr:hypothetical protein [Dehalococcoidales bacterium]